MRKITLTKEEAVDILDSGVDIVSNEAVNRSRWSIIHALIFKKDGKLYETYYSVGATESQDESPWEYDKEVECTEVEEYEKTVKAYRPVAD